LISYKILCQNLIAYLYIIMNVVTDVEDATARRNTVTSIAISENLNAENEETYKEIIKIWIERAIGYCLFFIILQASILTSIPSILTLAPLILLDLKILVFKYLFDKPERIFRFIFSKEILHQVFSLAFKTLLIIYITCHIFSALFIPIPVLLAFLNQYFQKIDKTHECKYLSWLVINN